MAKLIAQPLVFSAETADLPLELLTGHLKLTNLPDLLLTDKCPIDVLSFSLLLLLRLDVQLLLKLPNIVPLLGVNLALHMELLFEVESLGEPIGFLRRL